MVTSYFHMCTLFTKIQLLFSSDLIREVLKLDEEILTLAKSLYQERSLIVMGRGYNFATCLEGALVS